ncbi:MAG: hypothetical protein COB09_18490 [Thalassobium sp.]|nr:MAG: hypothetical protein COB09_18490 [Thalassobium sp.]
MATFTGSLATTLSLHALTYTPTMYTDGRRADTLHGKSHGIIGATATGVHNVIAIAPDVLAGVISGGLSEIVYNYVEADPQALNVGSVLNDTAYGFILYNRFLHSNEVTVATIVISDPTIVLVGINPGETIDRLSSTAQLVTIPGDGDDDIAFSITWTFTNGATTVLMVTGVRTSTQTSVPEFPMIEKLGYLSRIATTYTTEFRGVVRQHPRLTAKFNWMLDGPEASRFLAVLRNSEKDHFSFPMWREALPVSNLGPASTVLPFGSDDWDVQVNDSLFVYNRKAADEVVTITQVEATTTTITPTTIQITDSAWVMPMITGFLREKPEVSYGANDVVSISLEVESSTYYKWDTPLMTTFTDAGWETLDGYLVWPFLNRVFSGVKAGSLTTRAFNDHDSGNVDMVLLAAKVRDYYTLNYTAKDTSQITLFKRFTYYMRGRVGGFYLPSHRPDIVIGTLTVDIGSTIITADGLNGIEEYAGTYGIQFQFTDGTVHNAIATLLNQKDISFVPALTRSLVVADDVQMVCFMHLVRFNDDDIEIKHESPNKSTVSIPLVNII